MSLAADLYPPSVPGIPKDLAQPSPRYRQLVGVVLASLLLFLAFYLALVAGAGWLFWFALTYPMDEGGRGPWFLKIAGVAMSGMLFLFLLKALFKWHTTDNSMQVEVTEQDQPELFAFIRKLCHETGAPFPYKVFLTWDVNAAVFYNTSLLSLVFPVKKNLLIGLGLVNVLTMSEFKAVLAHEFGHFSQNSMRLGNYVYVANRVIADLVYQRDFWDNLLQQWKSIGDWRLALPGWLLYLLVWILRKILTAAFHLINLGEAALSREMEFHADLVAVSVTGSDSLIHALSRLDFANESLIQGLDDLKAAADHRLYTQDLYFHQVTSAEHLRKVRSDNKLGTPPPLPAEPGQMSQVFEPGSEGVSSMYASHPPNSDREQNAKRRYFRSIEDTRSPWLLFRNAEAIRQDMTARLYAEHMPLPQGAVPVDAPTVQAFIDEEHAETQQDARYFGLYDGRLIDPGDLTQRVHEVYYQPWAPQRLGQVYNRLYAGQLKDFSEAHQKRSKEQDTLGQLKSGEVKPKGGTFTFREQQHRLADLDGLIKQVETELEQDEQYFKQLDAEVFQAHYQMAQPQGLDQELWARYQFHLATQGILKSVSTEFMRVAGALEYMSSREQTSEEDFNEVSRILREARGALWNAMGQASQLGLPALKNMQAGARLSDFLLTDPVVADLPFGNSITGEWISSLMGQLQEVQGKTRRIHFKSLGAILALQERVAGQWRAGATTAIQSATSQPQTLA